MAKCSGVGVGGSYSTGGLSLALGLHLLGGAALPRDNPHKKFEHIFFDEKRYLFCGKGFRKLIFKLLMRIIERLPPPAAARGAPGRPGYSSKGDAVGGGRSGWG